MKEYVAKTNTAVYPYGVIRRGEALQQKHIEALGSQGLADLLARDVIAAIGEAPETHAEPVAVDLESAEDMAGGSAEAMEDYDEGDALDDLELPGLEDTVGEAEAEAPADKKNKGRSRAK